MINYIYTSPTDIKEAATSYFSSLFTNDTTERAIMEPLGLSKLSTQQAQHLEQEVTIEEVKQAIWSCDGTKLEPAFTCYKTT